MRFEKHQETPKVSAGPERKSGAVRIVGVEGEEERKILSDLAEEVFWSTEKFQVPGMHEVPKTPEQKEVIAFLIKEIPLFVKKYGAEPLALKEDHVVLLRQNILKRLLAALRRNPKTGRFVTASYSVEKQRVKYVYNSDESLLYFAQSLAHEFLHFQSFQSFRKTVDEEGKVLIQRRTGLRIVAEEEGGRKALFNDLDEAVIEELARRFSEEIIARCHIGTIQQDIQERKEVQDVLIKRGQRELAYEVVALEGGGQRAISVYVRERSKLKEVIAKIYKKNKKQFSSKEAVFEVFARAVMSGRLLPLARLMEQTLGKGSFRQLGEETKK